MLEVPTLGGGSGCGGDHEIHAELARRSPGDQGDGRRDRNASCRRSGSRSRASTNPAENLEAFRVARIVEAGKHPNADKLQVIQVEVEKGAPLLRSGLWRSQRARGMLGVFAPLGTYIPGSKITLEKKPVRGVVSNGMMCSAAELELSSESRRHYRAAGQRWRGIVGERYVDAMPVSPIRCSR